MRSSTISIVMDVLTKILVILISGRRHYHSGYIFSGVRGWNSLHQKTVEGLQDTARNDARFGFSWLISLFQGEGFRLSLFFLNYIMLSLWYVSTFNKRLYTSVPYEHLPQVLRADIRAWGFFMATSFPSVLRLSRLPKKSRNFNSWIVIGSGKTTSAQNVAGVWGVCWHGATLFHRYNNELSI